MKKNLFILGMHRSGTSAIAGAVAKCGFYPGPNLLPPDPHFNDSGFFESDTVLSIHNKFFTEFGVDWRHCYRLPEDCFASAAADKARVEISSLLDEMQGQQPWCLKDPRASVLFPLWKSVLDEKGVDYQVLLAQRSPTAVAASLLRRNNITTNHSLLLWLYHCLNAELHSRAVNRVIIHYERFIQNPHAILGSAFAELGMTSIEVPEALDVDKKLQHVSGERGDCPEWILDIEAALGVSKPDQRNLDKVRDQVWPVLSLLPDVMALEGAAGSRLQSLELATDHINNLEQVILSEKRGRQASDCQINTLNRKLDESRLALQDSSEKLESVSVEMAKTRKELDVTKQAYQAVTSSTVWRLTRPVRQMVEKVREFRSRLNVHQIALKPENQIQLVDGTYEITGPESKFLLVSNKNEFPIGPCTFVFDLAKNSDLVPFKLVVNLESEGVEGEGGGGEKEKHEVALPAPSHGKNAVRFEALPRINSLELWPLASTGKFDLRGCYLQPLT